MGANITWKSSEWLVACNQIGSRVVKITLESKALGRGKMRSTTVRQLEYTEICEG
jgi:hypothetical protein